VTKLALLALVAALGGCALMARRQENLLVKAGFERRAAESGERDLPPREIVDRWDGEKTVYLYADPDGCRCVYAGATQEYERYHWLEARENVLREMDGAAMNAAAIDDAP
jgi:hypothetical protein